MNRLTIIAEHSHHIGLSVLRYISIVTPGVLQVYAAKLLIANRGISTVAGMLAITLTWGLYVEWSVGGIMYRPDRFNKIFFQPSGILQQLRWPLTDRYAWRPDFWDLNYYTVIAGVWFIYYNIDKYYGQYFSS